MTATTDIYKHVLFRIAGESYSFFDRNKKQYHEINDKITQLVSSENQKNNLRLDICDILFVLINVFEDPNEKKLLINFKRDIFNGRIIQSNKIDAVSKIFTSELSKNYDLYNSVTKSIILLSDEINTIYPILYNQDLDIVKVICSTEKFQNGLLLSSEILLKYARQFHTGKNNVDESTLLGLWKYITRSIAKTTPFSTLTQLNIGTINNEINETLKIEERSPKIISEIRYNNYILELLLLLIKNHPLLFKFLTIKINSTIKETDEDFIFFTNNNNSESIQTIKKNEIIDFIVTEVRNENEINIGQLVEKILQILSSEFTSQHVEKYLFELIQTGLLYININLSGLDSEWDKSIKLFIERYIGNEEIGKEIIILLDQLIEKRLLYSQAICEQRELIISDINSLFNTLFSLLQKDDLINLLNSNSNNQYNFLNLENAQNVFLHKLPTKSDTLNVKNVIYEDTTKDINIQISQKHLYDFVNKLDYLLNAFSCIPYTHPEKLSNYNFYISNFKDHNEVNLLAFYERLYKAKAESPNIFAQYQNGNLNADANIINQKLFNFISVEQTHGNVEFSDNECNISSTFTDKLINTFKEYIQEREKISYGSFVQFYTEKDKGGNEVLHGVLNTGIMPGKGKMISRFLHLFNDGITEELKLWNIKNMGEDECFVENNDASFFNANLHPCLMPYEIEMPGGNTRNTTNLINIADLKVKINPETNELELYHKNGKQMQVYDLGFQNPMHRSNLYRLLILFGNNNGYPYYNVINLFNSLYRKQVEVPNVKMTVTVNPRITFDKTIILQRKQWQISLQSFGDFMKSHQPFKNNDFYFFIQKWRLSFYIPNEVFIRIYHQQNNNNQQNNNQNINRDDYKPQYINFLSPVSVKLFYKTINKAKNGNLMIEEMLPNGDQLFEINDSKYAMESLIQWQ